MSQPPVYTRQFNFSNFSTNNPTTPQPGVSLDNEFNAVKTTLDAVRTNMALLQRDDGNLANAVVGVDQLSPALLPQLGVSSVWITATAYAVDAVVSINNAIYKCAIAHTSGVFATDLAALRWTLIVDYTGGANNFIGTSTTSVAIGTGSKSFTTQAGKDFQTGRHVLVTSNADAAGRRMSGIVTAYSGTALTVNVEVSTGSGTYTDWTIRVDGERGATGATGSTGATGAGFPTADAAGTVNAITANFTPDITLSDKTTVSVVASGANTSTTPTFSPDGLTARTITKNGGQALAVGDISGAGHVLILQYNLANTRWELLNPAASGGSGATTLINTQTISSAVASVTVTGMTGYKSYALYIKDLAGSSSANALKMRVSDDAGSTFKTTANYNFAIFGQNSNTGTVVNVEALTSTTALSIGRIDNGTFSDALIIDIISAGSSVTNENFVIAMRGTDQSAGTIFLNGGGVYNQYITCNALQIYSSTGNITSGTFTLYGIN